MRRASLRGSVFGGGGCASLTALRFSKQLLRTLWGATNFATEAPDKLWVADITYVRSKEGFVYLAPSSSMPAAAEWSAGRWLPISGRNSSWMLCRWRSQEGSHLQGWCITQTVGCSTLRCLSERGLRTRDWYLRWGESVRPTTTPWPRALWPHCEDRASLPQQLAHPSDGEDRYLRIHRGLLQHPQEALRSRASKPCRVRGG